jgi:hypothetical protein
MWFLASILRSSRFMAEMKAQNMWDSVTVLTASDFGRTLTNNGAGTDHAWAGHDFVLGGALKVGLSWVGWFGWAVWLIGLISWVRLIAHVCGASVCVSVCLLNVLSDNVLHSQIYSKKKTPVVRLLQGGQIHGTYPSDLSEAGELNLGRGRLIPSSPLEAVWNSVAKWFGIKVRVLLLFLFSF